MVAWVILWCLVSVHTPGPAFPSRLQMAACSPWVPVCAFGHLWTLLQAWEFRFYASSSFGRQDVARAGHLWLQGSLYDFLAVVEFLG